EKEPDPNAAAVENSSPPFVGLPWVYASREGAVFTGRARRERAAASWAAQPPVGLPDLDDRAVEHDVRVALVQHPRLRDLGDLRVAGEQNGRRTRLPGEKRLRPERRVVALTRLRTEHRKLPRRRPALDEIDLRQSLHAADPGRVVDVHHLRLGL